VEETYDEYGLAYEGFELTSHEALVVDKDGSVVHARATASYVFTSGQHVSNVLGALHGGAQAMAAEHSCALMLAEMDGGQRDSNADVWMGDWMDARYISGAAGQILVKCSLIDRPNEDTAVLEGELRDLKKNRLATQFKIRMKRISAVH
jgi:acyl-coenzyme A thioesterase PaaI-like protein